MPICRVLFEAGRVAARFVLAESDPKKHRPCISWLWSFSREFFEKAEAAKTKRSLPLTKWPSAES